MKFHTMPGFLDHWFKRLAIPKPKTTADIEGFIDYLTKPLIDDELLMAIERAALIAGHLNWEQDHRPYYSIYPKVVASLTKTPLTTTAANLQYPTNSNCLLIRLAEGEELLGRGRCIFVASMVERGHPDRMVICVATHVVEDDPSGRFVLFLMHVNKDETIEEQLTKAGTTTEDYSQNNMEQMNDELIEASLRLALGVALLDHDPELIRPDVLERDKHKLDDTIDPARMAHLAARARQRGKYGWVVGEATDAAHRGPVAAHYRRGHWGFRWAGVGKTRLKWTKIKGSIIHRDKITKVPTGYLDEEGSCEDSKAQDTPT